MSDAFALQPVGALAPRPVVLSDLMARTVARDVALVVGAACLVGALAQISIHLSFTPVPITGQTLGVLVCGTALGWRRGLAAMVLYGLAGLAGVPWFAGHASGYVGADFGYVIGFVACAALCGWLAERRCDRRVWTSIPSMIAGEVVMYGIGVLWLAFALHVGAGKALALGFTPFVAGDALKAAIAAALLPLAWKVAGPRSRSLRGGGAS